jgi:hypothetical protein
MNWLSQMIIAPINLDKMYPPELSREKKEPNPGADNLIAANAARSVRVRGRIIKALGDDAITVAQLHDRLGRKPGRNTLGRMLRFMLEDGEVKVEDPRGTGKKLLWSAL